MPELCRFRGIVILMFSNEGVHNLAHFHARYAGHKATFLADGTLLAGALPDAQVRLVRRWAALHASEITANWERMRHGERPDRIDPLD